MEKDEYTPPQITRREAVGKFTIAGLGGAGAGDTMAMSPIGGGSPESPNSDSPGGSSPDSDSPESPGSDSPTYTGDEFQSIASEDVPEDGL